MANVARQHEDVWLSVCHAGSCELCGKPYINSWLECIQFVTVGQVCVCVCVCVYVGVLVCVCECACMRARVYVWVCVLPVQVHLHL